MSELLRKIKSLPQKIKDEADIVLAESALNMVNRAVNDAPRDQGFVVNQITMDRKGDMDYEVSSGSAVSVFLEFGTRQRFHNPYPDLNSFVSQFKGAKGAGKGTMLESIASWAKRKGIAAEAVFPIYRSILINGINPHPFFFKHYYTAVREIMDGLTAAIKNMK